MYLIGKIFYFFRYLWWLIKKKTYIEYDGFNCGCCGRWWDKPFKVPTYKSNGEWWDTWGLCPKEEKDCCWKVQSSTL